MVQPFGRITANASVIYPRYDPANFVGRQWLIEMLEAFIGNSDRRQFVVIGEPGSGKSALVAYLAEKWNCVRHFIRVDNISGITGTDPRHFLVSAGAQLYQKYGGEIFSQPSSVKVKVTVGAAKDNSQVVGMFIKELYQLPFLPVDVYQAQVHVESATDQSQVAGVQIGRLIDIAELLDEKSLLYAAVLNPILKLYELHPDETVVILIDALDESRFHSGKNILSVIPSPADADFPPNLRILMTSRPDEVLLGRFPAQDQLFLSGLDYQRHNLEDVQAYIARRLVESPLCERLRDWKPTEIDDFKRKIEIGSEGNFLYLVYLLNELASDEQADLRQITVPRGLDEIYRVFAVQKIRQQVPGAIQFTVTSGVSGADASGADLSAEIHARLASIPAVTAIHIQGDEVALMTADKDAVLPVLFTLGIGISNLRLPEIGVWEEKYIPILGVLSVAFEALTQPQLAYLSGVAEAYVATLMATLSQFLDETRGPGTNLYRLYHRSFGEYLLDPSRNRDYPIDRDAQHQNITSRYRKGLPTWDEVDWSQVDDYGLRHLSDHLYALRYRADYRAEFQRLICKPFMQAKRVRYGSHRSFAENIAVATALAGEETPPDLVQQVRNEMLYATLGSVSSNIPPEVLECLARVGKPRSAIDLAMLISDEERRYRACSLIATALLETGEYNELADALEISLRAKLIHAYNLMAVQSVSNNDIAGWLTDLAVLFDRAGRLDSFFEIYYRFSQAGFLNTMAILAEALAKKGQVDTARHVAGSVVQWFDQITKPETIIDNFTYAAQALALIGEQEMAVETAERAVKLTLQSKDRSLLIWLAPIFAYARQIDRALQLCENMPDEEAISMAKQGIVEAVLHGGELERALEIAKTISNSEKQDEAYALVAAGFAQGGQFVKALEVLESINNPVMYSKGLIKIIQSMVGAANFTQAQAALGCLEKLDGKLIFAERDSVGRPIPVNQNFVSSYLLSEIALGMAKAGKTDPAQSLVQQALGAAHMADEEDKPLLLRKAIQVYSALSMFDQAFPMLEQISDTSEKVAAVEDLITSMTAQGLYEPAREKLRSFREAASLSAGVQVLARAQIQANQLDEATALVEMVPVAFNKAMVMGGLVKDLLSQGHAARAASLLEGALLTAETNEDWLSIFRWGPEMADQLMKCNQKDFVSELADRLLELANRQVVTEWRVEGYASIAQVLLYYGEIPTAIDGINQVLQIPLADERRLRLVLDIAKAAREEKLSDSVVQLINLILPIIQQIQIPREQSAYLVEVVQALTNVKLFDGALSMISKISNKLHKALACCILAEGFAAAGFDEVAKQMLGSALQAAEGDFGTWQWEGQQMHYVREDIVQHLADYADAENKRIEALSRMALTFAALGEVENAAGIARRAEALVSGHDSVSSICRAAKALAMAGLTENARKLCSLAEDTLAKIEDTIPRALAWIQIGLARKALHQEDQARACVENAVRLLATAPYYIRNDLFEVLRDSAPIVAGWDEGRTLRELCQVILEIEAWWN